MLFRNFKFNFANIVYVMVLLNFPLRRLPHHADRRPCKWLLAIEFKPFGQAT